MLQNSAWCLCRKVRSTHLRRWVALASHTLRSLVCSPAVTHASHTCSPSDRSVPVHSNCLVAAIASNPSYWKFRARWYRRRAERRRLVCNGLSWCTCSVHYLLCPRFMPWWAGGRVGRFVWSEIQRLSLRPSVWRLPCDISAVCSTFLHPYLRQAQLRISTKLIHM